jgi:hypothetical protein
MNVNNENIKKDIIDILYPQKNKCFIENFNIINTSY